MNNIFTKTVIVLYHPQQETNFTCRSVEYSKTESSCHLSAATRSTIGSEIVTVTDVTYYELYCVGKFVSYIQ